MRKGIFVVWMLMLACMFASLSFAEEETEMIEIIGSGDYSYFINADGTVTIAGWSGKDETLVIPETIDGMQVTAIGYEAFSRCSSLMNIEIPDSITTIEESAFSSCKNLTGFTVSPENENYTVTDDVLFSTKDAALLCYPCGLTASEYIIPDWVAAIGDGAFAGCKNLTYVGIPDSVTAIRQWAFYDCGGLTSVVIPGSVTEIGENAFSWCEGLTDIEISGSVTTIGARAFYSCSGLTNIRIPETVTKIGAGAFTWCDNITLSVAENSYAEQYAIDNNIPYIN